MNKTWLIIKREYLTRVRKKSFIILTLLIPFILLAFFAIEIFLVSGGSKEKQRIAVIDESGYFINKIGDGNSMSFQYLTDKKVDSFQNQYEQEGYTGLLYIPKIELDHPTGFTFYGKDQLGLDAYGYLTDHIDRVIEDERMVKAGIDKNKLDAIKADVSLVQPGTGSGGSKEGNTIASTVVGYVSGILIYFILFFFGMMVMRGVMEEKTNRIAEVVISSVRPFQLMIGKIVGIAAVGLTQFFIWIIMGIGAFAALSALAPGMAHHAGELQQMQMNGPQNQMAAAMMQKAGLVIDALPVAKIILCFIFYFLGGYLMYASLFAAVGSVVDQDAADSQQLTLPVTLPILLSFFIMFNAIQQPNSPLAVGASLFPLSSPLVMMARIPFGVPWWQLGLSMIFLVAGFLLTTLLAAKIYRTGILLYGKKVTLREMGKWLLRKS
ncbi:MAG TPA: ABC transporter permease [Chitinophagaceae bacterium]